MYTMYMYMRTAEQKRSGVGHPICPRLHNHDALNQVGAPVSQAGTPEASAAALKAYIYNIVLTTPISEEENGVEQEDGMYFHEVFHRLS